MFPIVIWGVSAGQPISRAWISDLFASISSYTSHLLLVVQIIILWISHEIDMLSAWLAAGAIIAFINLIAWAATVWRLNIIEDTPKSKIASAAQGYVELQGRASTKPEYLIVAKSGLPCVWFKCAVHERNDGDWQLNEVIISDSIFELDDGSGETCIIDPEHAKVVTSNKRTWYTERCQYVEEQLFPGQTLYVLGEFTTLNEHADQPEVHADVSRLLAEWKKNMPALLQRYDQDQDGKLNMDEWEQVRKAAYQQVRGQIRSIQEQPGINIIKRPKNGRPFLISNLPEQKLRQKYALWGWVHLLMFFASLLGSFWLAAKHGFF